MQRAMLQPTDAVTFSYKTGSKTTWSQTQFKFEKRAAKKQVETWTQKPKN
jgi:hypothetical protein